MIEPQTLDEEVFHTLRPSVGNPPPAAWRHSYPPPHMGKYSASAHEINYLILCKYDKKHKLKQKLFFRKDNNKTGIGTYLIHIFSPHN